MEGEDKNNAVMLFVIVVFLFCISLSVVYAASNIYAGYFIYPREYEEWTKIHEDYTGINNTKIHYMKDNITCEIYYKKYPTEVDRLRIVEQPEYGRLLPLRGKLVEDKLFYNESVNAEWRINPCVDTTIILEILHNGQRKVIVDTVNASCVCI